MKLKKLNAALALVTCVLLCLHMWTMTYSLYTGWYDYVICKTFAHILCAAFVLHVFVSICIFFFAHDGAAVTYKKANAVTILQRVSAIIMLILIHSHVRAYRHMATGEVLTSFVAARTCILEVIFMASVTTHTALSTPKALLTLGIVKSDRAYSAAQAVFAVLYGLSGLAAIFADIRFFVGG